MYWSGATISGNLVVWSSQGRRGCVISCQSHVIPTQAILVLTWFEPSCGVHSTQRYLYFLTSGLFADWDRPHKQTQSTDLAGEREGKRLQRWRKRWSAHRLQSGRLPHTPTIAQITAHTHQPLHTNSRTPVHIKLHIYPMWHNSGCT